MVPSSMLDMATPSVPEPSLTGEYLVGDVIADKYRLERLLGEGGQAWVWQARNLLLESPVALKVVRPDAQDPSQVRRLFQEARAAARLGHPAIVRIFDLGQTATGDPFLVMELLEGESLADRLVQRERLPPAEALRALLPIADALVTAHAQGIVHRDLKPDNVFLQREGEREQPKLLDFGVVKLQHGSALEHLTETGAVVGTPAYLSPEQARGRTDIDERSDVWSFCATLYECVTGELPFIGSNYNALLLCIIEEHPRSILEYGVGDERLWAIMQRGLAKSATERWQSMLALGCELAGWLSDHGVADDVCGTLLRTKWVTREEPRRELAVGLLAEREEAASLAQEPQLRTLLSGHDASSSAVGASPSPALYRKRLALAAAAALALVVALGLTVWWPETPSATAVAAPPAAHVVAAPPPVTPDLVPAAPSSIVEQPKSAEPDVAVVALPAVVEAVPKPSVTARSPAPSAVRASPRAPNGPTAPPARSAGPSRESPQPHNTKLDLDILNPY